MEQDRPMELPPGGRSAGTGGRAAGSPRFRGHTAVCINWSIKGRQGHRVSWWIESLQARDLGITAAQPTITTSGSGSAGIVPGRRLRETSRRLTTRIQRPVRVPLDVTVPEWPKSTGTRLSQESGPVWRGHGRCIPPAKSLPKVINRLSLMSMEFWLQFEYVLKFWEIVASAEDDGNRSAALQGREQTGDMGGRRREWFSGDGFWGTKVGAIFKEAGVMLYFEQRRPL